jgi:hypothetical protein
MVIQGFKKHSKSAEDESKHQLALSASPLPPFHHSPVVSWHPSKRQIIQKMPSRSS